MKKIAFLIKSGEKFFLPFNHFRHIKSIRSASGKEIQADIITLPAASDKFIASACQKAKHLGAEMIGFDLNLYPWLQKNTLGIIENLNIPFNDGSIFTSWSIFEAVYRICKAKEINLMGSTVLIFGANKQVAGLCCRKLADCVNNISVAPSAEEFKKTAKNADILINLGTSENVSFDITALKERAIVCELYGCGVNPSDKLLRSDCTFIKTGLIKVPYPKKFCIYNRMPKGIICASLAETMLLAFEEKFANYSCAENINPDKLEEIADIAAGCGFEVWLPEAPVF
ncbi:MAG: hypothetical protein WC628_02815 [Candidatus Omnitrophota bacterium]